MKIHVLRSLLLKVLFLLLLITSFSISWAEDEAPTIYMCVAPRAEDAIPYVIEFRDTSVFGLIIPQDAIIQVYSNVHYSGALYTIAPDAQTGGYRTLEALAQINTFTIIPATSPCLDLEQYKDVLSAQPFQSVPVPTSANHALVFQEDGSDMLTNAFRRVINLTFYVDDDVEQWDSFQVIQISDAEPFLTFRLPSIDANTPFVIIANKDFALSQSLQSTVPPEFSRERPSDVRSFVYSDLNDLYGVNIFDVLVEAKARIYPNSGLIDTYRGTYIRLSLAPDMALRDLPFQTGSLVRSLSDVEAQYVSMNQLEDNPLRVGIDFDGNAMGRIRGDSVLRVVKVEPESGQLVIAVDENRQAIIQSWLVEVVEKDE